MAVYNILFFVRSLEPTFLDDSVDRTRSAVQSGWVFAQGAIRPSHDFGLPSTSKCTESVVMLSCLWATVGDELCTEFQGSTCLWAAFPIIYRGNARLPANKYFDWLDSYIGLDVLQKCAADFDKDLQLKIVLGIWKEDMSVHICI